MSTEHLHDAEVFEAALQFTDPSHQALYVEAACAGDQPRRRRLLAMLATQPAAQEFFDRQSAGIHQWIPNDSLEDTRVDPHAVSEVGERIGPYKLLQVIGEGGFGTVWMAEQLEPVQRRVALKIIKLGMDTREVITRFEAERQALAMMDHPNIAKVFDAGATPSGRPYFVMELVKGMPITEFCDEHRLRTRARLGLIAEVCAAINHAHQKGIIHRDVKPSNVLITLHGDTPVVKVIDFGIAKATQGRLTDKTLFTRFEQFVGTPVYMSPEQTSQSGLDVDTRSDIYSLGILMYELLAGKPPFDAQTLAAAGYEEMRRIIREVEPPRPSSRLSTAAGSERTALAHARRVAPDKLDRLVDADLDWIVMKAIDKDRSRRYETANGLALDIQRFLADEPVSASPPSALYRCRKFARRHKAAFRSAAALLGLLVAATAFSSWLAYRATRAEKQAEANLKAAIKAQHETEAQTAAARSAQADSEAYNDFLVKHILAAGRPMDHDVDDSGRSGDILLSEALQRSEPSIAEVFEGRPAAEARTRYHLGYTWNVLGRYREGEAQLRRALDLATNEQVATERRDDVDMLVVFTRQALGMSLRSMKRFDEALTLARQNLAMVEHLGWKDPQVISAVTAELGGTYLDMGRHDEALPLWERCLEIHPVVAGDYFSHRLLLDHTEKLATALRALDRADEIPTMLKSTWAVVEGAAGLPPYQKSMLRYRWAELIDRPPPAELLEIIGNHRSDLEKAFGPHHPQVLALVEEEIDVLRVLLRNKDAEVLARQWITIAEQGLGPNRRQTLELKLKLAEVLDDSRATVSEARALVDAVADASERAFGAGDPLTLAARFESLNPPSTRAEVAEQVRLCEEMLGLADGIPLRGGFKDESSSRTPVILVLSSLKSEMGEGKEAERLAAQALALSERKRHNEYEVFLGRSLLCGAFATQGKMDQAVAQFEELIDETTDHPEVGLPLLQTERLRFGWTLHRQNDLLRAEALAREILATEQEAPDPAEGVITSALRLLFSCLVRGGQLDEYAKLAGEVHEWAEATLGPDHFARLLSAVWYVRALIYTRAWDKAEAVSRQNVERADRVFSSLEENSLAVLMVHGEVLLGAGKPKEAEPVLRRCLAGWRQTEPGSWVVSHVQALLGGCLLAEKRFAEAASLLREAHAGFTAAREDVINPDRSFFELRFRECLERLVALEEATGRPAEAAQWRTLLEQETKKAR